MMGFIIFIQAVTCALLIVAVLMQSGRGGGLTEAFASAESMFGAKTNEVMVRVTVVLATVFLASTILLAHLSSKRERSLFEQTGAVKRTPAAQGVPAVVPTATNAMAETR